MKKIVLVILVMGLVPLGYFSFYISQVDSSVSVATNSVELSLDENLDVPILEYEVLDEKEENLTLDEVDKALVLEAKSLEEIEPEMVEERKDTWVQADIEDVEKEFSAKEGVSPLNAIKLPKNSIKNLNVGDTVLLPNMGSGEFEAKITERKRHKNGSVTVTGNLIGSGNQYSVVLTEGQNMSFGTVNTPNGSFEIETRNGVGYVYSTDDIDRAYIDHSKSDVLVPHIDKPKKIR